MSQDKNKSAQEFLPGVGLDCGTSTIIACRGLKDGVIYNKKRNAFVDFVKSKSVLQILKSMKIDYIEYEGKIVVVGDSAIQFAASMKDKILRRPMNNGVLSSKDNLASDVMYEMIRSAVGAPVVENESCIFSIPAQPDDVDFDVRYHSTVVQEILADLGYNASPVNEGLCVVYSTLGQDKYTGVGISFGAGLTNVCYSTLGMESECFALNKGGDWIDKFAANVKFGTSISQVIQKKEDQVLPIDLAKDYSLEDKIKHGIVVGYEVLFEEIINLVNQKMEDHEEIINPIPVVLAGGGTMPKGFLDKFEETRKECPFTFPVSEIKIAEKPLYAISYGAYIRSSIE